MTTTTRTKEAMLDTMMELNKQNDYNKDGKKRAVTYFKNAQKVGNKVYLDIPLEMLKVDREMYQRPVQRHVKKIAMEWNDDKCDALIVNYRNDGYFYILDGQHRFEAGLMRNMDSIVCNVFVGMTVKEEAELFVEQNEGTKKLTPYDTYKANVCRGDIVDCAIKEVCDCYGIKVVKSSTPNTLKSVTRARTIIKNCGKDGLHWIFALIAEAGWNNFKDTYTDTMLNAFYNVYQNCQNNLPLAKERLVEFCKVTTPKEVVALANIEFPMYGDHSRVIFLFDTVIKENGKQNKVVKLKNVAM